MVVKGGELTFATAQNVNEEVRNAAYSAKLTGVSA